MSIPLPNKGLYVVVTKKFAQGRTHKEILPALLKAGVQLIQLREKEMPKRELYKLGLYYRKETKKAGACFIVNDALDIAMAVDADGVHLGQDDFPAKIAMEMWKGHIIGISTHSMEEAQTAAKLTPGYINIGPIFQTKTKQHSSGAIGIEVFKQITQCLDVPLTVMGGINESNLDLVLEAGARRIAMVTGVIAASDIEERAKSLQERILK